MQRHILNSLKKQKMVGKTIRLNWEEWQEYCSEHGLNPHDCSYDGYDLGGGDSYEVVCHDVPEED